MSSVYQSALCLEWYECSGVCVCVCTVAFNMSLSHAGFGARVITCDRLFFFEILHTFGILLALSVSLQTISIRIYTLHERSFTLARVFTHKNTYTQREREGDQSFRSIILNANQAQVRTD